MLAPAVEQAWLFPRSNRESLGVNDMRILTAVLGAVTAITLLSGCAYDQRYDTYGYGYGNGYSNGYYYDGDRYDRSNYYGRYDRNCWYDRDGYRRCVRR